MPQTPVGHFNRFYYLAVTRDYSNPEALPFCSSQTSARVSAAKAVDSLRQSHASLTATLQQEDTSWNRHASSMPISCSCFGFPMPQEFAQATSDKLRLLPGFHFLTTRIKPGFPFGEINPCVFSVHFGVVQKSNPGDCIPWNNVPPHCQARGLSSAEEHPGGLYAEGRALGRGDKNCCRGRPWGLCSQER